MSFISEARSPQLIPPPPIPKETPIVRNLECNVVTAQRRWAGLERGEKVKPKSRPYSGMETEPGRNVRRGGRGLSGVTNLPNAESRGRGKGQKYGKKREGENVEKFI